MYAVISTGGKQYRVETGEKITVEKLNGEVGQVLELDSVLMIADGENIKIGNPSVKGARVLAEVLAHKKGKKIIAFKHKRRKDYQRKVGHRQEYTELEVKEIKVGGE